MNAPPLRNLHDLRREDLAAAFREAGLPAYRAGQVWRWLYQRYADNWDAMTDLPADLRARLAAAWDVDPVRLVRVDGDPESTRKLLLELRGGDLIECVLIYAQGRRTVCVSSQVGCKFGCVFCASGQAGFRRNLSAGEIVAQVTHAARQIGDRPTNIVFMGIGEPFDNTDAVLQALRILNDPEGLRIGARHITVSTVGVVPGIRRLAGEGMQVELSVSLHAPDDELRGRLMPVNRRYPVAELMDACAAYARATKRVITFEYTLIAGWNDSVEMAELLADRIAGFPSRVNLIRLNPIEEFDAAACPQQAVDRFLRVLHARGINATYRDSRGRSVDAACGQLRVRELRARDAAVATEKTPCPAPLNRQ